MGMKEAKEQFIRFGRVRNDFVRKEILSSWERSRIFKVSQIESETQVNYQDDQSLALYQRSKNEISGQAMLVNSSGDLLFQMGNEFPLNAIMNVEEKKIGTTAFALSFLTKEFEFVEHEEHYLNIFEPYNSYAKYNLGESIWTLYFSKTTCTINELCALEDKLIENYKRQIIAKKEKMKMKECIFLNRENIDKTIVLAGISREILTAKKQIEETFSDSVNLKLITKCKLTLHALVEFFIEKKTKNTKEIDEIGVTCITKENVNALEKLDHNTIIYIEEVHKFSYKQQMHLARQMQGKQRDQCFVWGFYSIQDVEQIRNTSIPLIFEYLRGNQVEVRDLDLRRADITFIAQKYVALNYPEMKVESNFYQFLSDLKLSKQLEDLLNYLRFVCDLNSQMKRIETHVENKRLLNDGSIKSVRESNEGVDCMTLKDGEREQIEKALQLNQYQLNKTALALGIGRTTLYRKMKHYNIQK